MGLPVAYATAPKEARTLAEWEPFPRVLEDDERECIAEVCAPVSPRAARWMEAYLLTGNKTTAAAMVGISPRTARGWTGRHPALASLLDSYLPEIRDRWHAVAENRATEGFSEYVYDKDGNLKHSKVKQDPSFLRAFLGSIDPDRWSSQDKPAQITVNVLQVSE